MRTIKKIAKWIGLIGLALVAVVAVFYFVYVKPVLNKIEESRIVEYDKDLTIYEGGGGNSGILVSDSLVLVVDTKMGDAMETFAAKVKEVAGNKPILVVNTHYHIDHTSGNDLYAGQTIIAGGGYTPEIWKQEAKEEDLPTQWLPGRKDIKMGDDTATLITFNMKAHTVGDVFVYLHRRKVLFGGDVILNGQVPSVANGDPEGYLVAFDKLQKEFDIKTIVPGHGPTGGIEILDTFRQYFNDMKLAAADPSKRGELINKYEIWTQVPFMMSSKNVVDAFKKDK
jgi:glyoxylase-like metal-dependent hydrolase (beta-lactamase superfamily II)